MDTKFALICATQTMFQTLVLMLVCKRGGGKGKEKKEGREMRKIYEKTKN